MLSIRLRSAAILIIVLLVAAPCVWAETLAITGGTVIDGTGNDPIENGVVVISDDRIRAVGRTPDVVIPESATRIDAAGKYVIPGLMDANVHLFINLDLETLIRYEDRYHEIIIEGAQIALKSGLTTVFDTWGPRAALVKARDTINAGEAPGSRFYLAGNIIGFDGPFSADFLPPPPPFMLSKAFTARTNETWQQGTGRELMWMGPEEVRAIVREYATNDVDFLKYGASGHTEMSFICFSPRVQRVIVEEAHRAGMTVQVHATSVESLDMAIEAGVDIITHGDISGPTVEIPDETIRKLVDRDIPVSVLPVTKRRLDALLVKQNVLAPFMKIATLNLDKMIKAGVTMMVSTDAGIENPVLAAESDDPTVDPSVKLGEGHFNTMAALEERGMEPMEILKSATSNIAMAYKKDADIGTIEAGKIADLVILDKNPLESAQNYRSIHAVIKNGEVVDLAALPVAPIISSMTVPEDGGTSHGSE